MNSGKLSADVQTGGNLNTQVNNAAEPGSRPVGAVHGDGRNLDQEGQQFANLLHSPGEAATSSADVLPERLPVGHPFEHPFSIHLKHAAPVNPEHPAPINPEYPAPTDHEHPAINPEYPILIPPPFLTGQERVLPTSVGPGAGVKVENPAVPVADATLPTPQPSAEPTMAPPAPATMTNFQSELKSSTDPTAKTLPPPVNERGVVGLSMTQGAEKPVQPTVIPPKETTQPESTTSADSKPEPPTGDRILQGLLGQPAQPTTPFLDQPASPVSSSDRIHQVDELADQLAQRILVSDRTHTTDSEVRIQLRDTVLQGTEIIIRRDQGQLVVNFNVTDAYVAQQLSPRTNDLQQALSTKLDTSVRIEVNVSSQDTGGQGSSGDGRSRNRRDPNEEWGMES